MCAYYEAWCGVGRMKKKRDIESKKNVAKVMQKSCILNSTNPQFCGFRPEQVDSLMQKI